MTNYKLGALPPTAKPKVRLAPFLTSDEPTPMSVNFLPREIAWGVLGNDRYGDCAWAGIAHLLMANAHYTRADEICFTDDNVLAAYSDATGFNPADPNSDQGTVLQDALNFMSTTGMSDANGNLHKIVAFAQVDAANPDEVDRAHQLFGGTYNGFSVYKFMMDEFDAGKPWTDHSENRGSLDGGHCVPTMRTNVDRGSRTCVTWGKPQPIGPAFWKNYFFESWVAITPEWIDANGRSPSGLDLQGLLAEVERLRSR